MRLDTLLTILNEMRKMMIEYTEEIHAKLLIEILEKPNIYYKCPYRQLEPYSSVTDACKICQGFIGHGNVFKPKPGCPCLILGSREAIKRSWIALEEKGYI